MLATFAASSTNLNLNLLANEQATITSTGTSYSVALTGGTWSGTNSTNVSGNGTVTLVVTASGLSAFDKINLTDSGAGAGVVFGTSTGSFGDEFNVSLDNGSNPLSFSGAVTLVADTSFTANVTGTISLSNNASDIIASGIGAISLSTSRDIALSAGSSITTVNGNLTLSANQQALATTVPFDGINVNNAIVQTLGSGNVNVSGKGGTSPNGAPYGVIIQGGGAIIGGVSGTVSVSGFGGAGTSSSDVGVGVSGTNSIITSNGGNVTVQGLGGGSTGSGPGNYGVYVSSGGQIASAGSGTVSVTGTGGSSTATSNFGVYVATAGRITSGGTGIVSVTGTGGSGTGGLNYGVHIVDANSAITSGGGNISVTGNGGGPGNGNYGVLVNTSGRITGGGGTVSVTGSGGIGAGTSNFGVYVSGSSSAITSSSSVSVTSTGNSVSPAVRLTSGGSIASSSGAPINVTADSINIVDTSTFNAGTGTVTIKQRTAGTVINLGGNDVLSGSPLTLGLTEAEIDQINAGTLQIGDSNSGPLAVNGAITHGNNLSLTTGGVATFSNTVMLAPGKSLHTIASGGISFNAASGVQTSGDVVLVADSGGTSGTLTVSAGASIYGKTVELRAANVGIDSTASIGSSTPYSSVMLNNSPIAYYRFNESSGTNAVGAGSIGNGTYQNGVGLGSSGAISDDTAANFDGVNDYVTVPSSWNAFSNAGTMMAWINLDSLDNEPIFAKQDSAVATYGVFSVGTLATPTGFPQASAPGRLFFHGSNTSSVFNATAGSNGVLTAGKYYHVAVVYTPASASFYINGVLDSVTSGNFSTSLLVSEFSPLSTIGAWPVYGGYFDGSIDEFSIYPIALNGSEIAARYANGNPAPNRTTDIVYVSPSQSGRGINLGTATGQLDLTDSELDRITAPSLGQSTTGTITVGSPITSANNLRLTSGAGINVNDAVAMASGRSFFATSLSTTAGITLGTTNSDISATGIGTIDLASTHGISMLSGSSVTTVNGNIMLSANQQATPTTGSFIGINVDNGLIRSTGTGSLSINGKGGNSSLGEQYGVLVHNSGDIIGGSAPTTVTGEGGNSAGGLNIGLYVVDAGSSITSSSGSVSLNGKGGGTGFRNYGTLLEAGGVVSASGSGVVSVVGLGGASPTLNNGVFITGTGSQITSSGGAITVTATGQTDSEALRIQSGGSINSGGNAAITIDADSFVTVGTASINSGAGRTTIRPRTTGTKIDLGGINVLTSSPLTLGLSDPELDFITAGTLVIGSTTSGSITVSSDIDRSTSTAVSLFTAGDIGISGGQINTGGGTLLLDSGVSPAVVKPTKAGIDVTASTLSFAGDLSIAINGSTVDTQFTQLDVVGGVNLTGVALKLSGSYTPNTADSFIIVDNDGSDPIVGTFNSLTEGTILNVNGRNKRITYVGGSGNDVELKSFNQSPIVTPATFSVSENSSNGTVVGTVVASDPDNDQTLSFSITAGNTSNAFAIDSTGKITITNAAVLNYESTPSFSLTVQATDNASTPLSGTAIVTINLTNVNEPPVVDDQIFGVAENSGNGTVVGSLVTSDVDAGDSRTIVVIGGTGVSIFAVNSSNGQITVVDGSALNFEATSSYTLDVRVTDADGLLDTAQVTINATNVNEIPTALSLSSTSIAENLFANAVVGLLSSSDPDIGDTFTYDLVAGDGSADNGAFTIVGSQLVANSSFNYESKNSYAIRVRTTDSGLLSFEKELTISVENVLEMPTPVQIGDGTTQRSVVNKLVVSFDQAIEFDAGAFQVYQRTQDSNNALVLVLVTTNVTLTATANGMTATLTFSGSLTRSGTNSLVDGNYQLTINGALIRILSTAKTFDADSDGNGGGFYTLGTQAADNFFALLGDANGNGEVDAQDLLGAKLALRKTVGQAGYNIAYDLNGNGVVDAQDILNIQMNLRKKRVFF